MSLEQFLDSKRKEYLLNDQLKEWSKGSKILDEHGFPMVTFHGTFSPNIEEIKIEASNHQWFAGSGFYTSNSLEDINEHYVSTKINHDYSHKKEHLIDNLSNENSILFYNNLFGINNLSDYLSFSDEGLDSASLTYEYANHLLEKLGIKELYNLEDFSEDDLITFEDFLREHDDHILKQNEGCIYPVFIKMERPLYLTKDDNATKLTFISIDQMTFIDNNKNEPERFNNFIEELYVLLREEGCPLIKDRLESFYPEYDVYVDPSSCSETFFEELNSYLENEYDFEDNELDEILNKVKSLMNDYGYYNLEHEHFEEMIFFSVDLNDESLQNYINFIEMIPQNYNYNIYISALNQIANDYYEENDTYKIDFFDFHHLLKENQDLIDTNFLKDYELILHKLYDGVVLSVDSMIDEGRWIFKVPLDTYHYIVFDPKNVKSAIGNNGDYSLDNLKICAKMHNNQINESKEKNINSVKKYIKQFQQEYPMIQFSYEYIEQEVEALYDKEEKKVIFNSKYIHNKQQLKKAFQHEVFGHFALDFVLGKDKDLFLESLGKKIQDSDLMMLELTYPHLNMSKPKERLLLIEEKIAEYAESKQRKNNFLNNALTFIEFKFKQFKQKFGLSTFKDDIFVFLHVAKNHIENNVKHNTNNFKKMSLKN